MEIEFNLQESVDKNAGRYFDLAKKYKRKLEGAKSALEESRKKLSELQHQEEKFLQKEEQKKQQHSRKQEWYEKFHWFFSSEGFLCIGGKDATSNEMIIKKHTEKDDLVFHTDMSGSPFFVIKHGQQAGEITLRETAQAVGVYSRAWKLGHSLADVFYVKPEQVSKEAQSGEHLAKGSFMVYGKTNYLYPKLEYAIGLVEEQHHEATGESIIIKRIIGGPITAIESKTKKLVIIIPGKEKKSSLAKRVLARLHGGEVDDVIKFLPAGGGEIKR